MGLRDIDMGGVEVDPQERCGVVDLPTMWW